MPTTEAVPRSYHVNPESGQVSRCKARVACPFGGENFHYPSPETAREAYEALAGSVVEKHAKLNSEFLAAEGRLERTYAMLKAVRTRILEGRPKEDNLGADLEKLSGLEENVRQGIREVRDAWYARELAYRECVEAGLMDPEALRQNVNTKFFKRANAIAKRTLRGVNVVMDGELKPAYRASAIEELAAWRGITREEAELLFDELPEEGRRLDEHRVSLFQSSARPAREVYVDLETSSFHASCGEIIEVGVVVVENGEVVEEYAERFDFENAAIRRQLGTGNEAVHKIGVQDLEGKRSFSDPEVQAKLGAILNDPEAVLIAHHKPFEMAWLSQELTGFADARDPDSAANIGRRLRGERVAVNGDSRSLASFMLHSTASNSLEVFSQANGVAYHDAHTAIVDARITQAAHENFRKAVLSSSSGLRPHLSYPGMPLKDGDRPAS